MTPNDAGAYATRLILIRRHRSATTALDELATHFLAAYVVRIPTPDADARGEAIDSMTRAGWELVRSPVAQFTPQGPLLVDVDQKDSHLLIATTEQTVFDGPPPARSTDGEFEAWLQIARATNAVLVFVAFRNDDIRTESDLESAATAGVLLGADVGHMTLS